LAERAVFLFSTMPSLSKLKVCYMAGTLGQGGAERQLFYAIQALQQSGAATRVLSLESGGFWEEPIRQVGAKVTCLGAERSRLKRLIRIVRLLKLEPPDILQAQHFYTNAYATLAGRFLNCKAIGALRNDGRFDLQESGRVGGRINLHLPKMLAANSQSAIRYAIRQGVKASRLYFLPNVVDIERFRPAPGMADRPMTLLAVGRLSIEKRFDRFLSLLHRLRAEQRIDVRGIIVGATRPRQNLRNELEQQAAALGLLPDGVQFLGSISDMSSVYRQATISVLTSDHEGTPNVLLEAMAAGLPVVGTNVGGVPDIIRDGQTGFLIEPADSERLFSATVELIRNAELREKMGAQARAYVEANHSVHRLPMHLNGLYELAFSAARGAKSVAIPLPMNTCEADSTFRTGARRAP
jgi:glycosyltransferase involved in cell wall biosynthesis